jgi:hypothetical protein
LTCLGWLVGIPIVAGGGGHETHWGGASGQVGPIRLQGDHILFFWLFDPECWLGNGVLKEGHFLVDWNAHIKMRFELIISPRFEAH